VIATTSLPALLEVRHLSVRLSGRQALENVSLDLGAGELVGLIGPNGAGKTTLLRAILGLLPVETGHVLVAGEPPVRNRWLIGYVPQRHEFAWDFPVSVEEAVMTGRTRVIGWLRQPRRLDREAVDEAMERASVADLRRRPIAELSGGQRQRVLVARALALRPKVLLLDEPFTGVDIPTQEALIHLLARLRAEGQALLMTTHDVQSALETCTRLVLLNRTIVASGTLDELRNPDLWLQAYGVGSSRQLFASLGMKV
jgi:manganese/iron transport system ATP-binding protein